MYNTTEDHYSKRAYCVFIGKFAAATKNLKPNYTFFVKPASILLIRETRRQIF